MVTSASYIIAAGKFGDGFYYAKKQGLAMVVGLGIMYLFSLINPQFWKLAAYPLLGVGILLLGMVFVPGIGIEMGGSHRWLRLPFGFYFQPSELIKYALINFFAWSLAKKGDSIRDFAVGFLPSYSRYGISGVANPCPTRFWLRGSYNYSRFFDAVRGRRQATASFGLCHTVPAIFDPFRCQCAISSFKIEDFSGSLDSIL